MARVDAKLTRLAIAYNAIVARNLQDQLPEDLRGDVIPNQVLQHEEVLNRKSGQSAAESGSRSEAKEIYDKTENLLRRVRHAVLAAFEDSEDPDIAALGPLGIGNTDDENQRRLANLATTIAPLVAAGTVAVVPALEPTALRAHAERHGAMNRDKGTATATRQTGAKSLQQERADTRTMLRRIRGFVIAQLGPEALDEFGFGIPVPPSRPRLTRGEPTPSA